MKQFQCSALGFKAYGLADIVKFPRSVPAIAILDVGEIAHDVDGDAWVRLPDLVAPAITDEPKRDERLERIAAPVFAAMINASPMLSAHVLATTAVDFAKALIAELDKQA